MSDDLVMEWRDISTAPRDGTVFQCYYTADGFSWPCAWDAYEKVWVVPDYNDPPLDQGCVTHWHPKFTLPEPRQ